MEPPGAADYSEMADAGKGQCEERTVSGCTSRSWQRPIQLVHLVHLAHLSQVGCQFGSRPKALQNNNLQSYSCLFAPTWLTLRTHTKDRSVRPVPSSNGATRRVGLAPFRDRGMMAPRDLQNRSL